MKTLRRHKAPMRIFCAAMLLIAGCAQPDTRLSAEQMLATSSRDFLGNLPHRVLDDAEYTFSDRNNLLALLLAGGGCAAMHNTNADKNLDDNFRNHRSFQGFSDEALNFAGCPATHFALAALWYLNSLSTQDVTGREHAWTMLSALSVTSLTTLTLKAARDNVTPNGKRWAWPSGHTSSSFAAAAVLDEFYGPKVGIPAYLTASLVGWRMMDTGDHWASDVLFGAVLGWTVGHTVAGRYKQLEIGGFTVLPYLATPQGPAVGINLTNRF